MADLSESILSEGIKPASGFITALLGPKIEKVRKWASEKDLEGRVEPDKLQAVFNEYLLKLADRVCELTSIAFPLSKLNIFNAYEPLHLIRQGPDGVRGRRVGVDEIIEGHRKSFLIIDNAGMGKSTFTRHLITQILFKSDRIPILFDLRKVDVGLTIPENLAKELDLIGSEFPRDVFYRLIKLGKFVVIVDGFDEVSVDSQVEIANEIHELSTKGGDNKLILTSRPQETLPDLLSSQTLKFQSFTPQQAKSLMRRYDNFAGLDVGERLSAQLDNVPEKFLETPLLVSLLYRTFGTNNSIADRISTFYDEIYHALYKGHDLTNKNGFFREKRSGLDFEDFRRLLRSLCYYMMLTKKVSFKNWTEAIKYIDSAIRISSIFPTSPSKFLDDLMVAVPLMHRDGVEYKFSHKTLIEYFSAEYIVYHNKSLELLNRIFQSDSVRGFAKVFEFINDINPKLFDSVATRYLASVGLEGFPAGDIWSRVFHSATFGKRMCKIGLWNKDKYASSSDGGDRDLLNELAWAELRRHGSAYFDVEYAGEEYFFVITWENLPGFHWLAWEKISEIVNLEPEISRLVNDKTVETIGVNEWTDLTPEISDKLKDCAAAQELICSALPPMITNGRVERRVFSEVNACQVLERIEADSALEKELDGLLQ